MKRLITLYVVSFGVAVTSFSLALAGLLQPKWIHFATPHSSPLELSTNFGLFQRCDSSQWTGARVTCRRFPTRRQDCQAPGLSAVDKATLHSLFHDPASTPESTSGLSIRPSALELQALLGAVPADTNDAWGFCDSWISAGYFQQLSLVLGFAAVIACFAAIVTPLHSRRKPYRLISSLLFGHAVALIASTSLVAHEFNTSDRFVYGSRLAQSFVMSTTAWSLDVIVVAALVLVIGFLKVGDEGGYERIQD
ncbi:BQ5605_C018g08715 [Microbotryum silenes-dioicae]|uniref:BQ5605_C018g08715 protein n=1 Tax=Microbotryum silenes-dioicae TaxID=796604 RepID=A0A2X0P0B9_9BASI|nr:BQ5605_C018g08715 [Microbotryum silenes-dioicae]